MSNLAALYKFQLKDISKWPLAFALVVCIYLVDKFMISANSSNAQRITELEKQLHREIGSNRKKDSIISEWQGKYIIEVEKNATYFKKLDSINRAALEKPAKEILETIKPKRND